MSGNKQQGYECPKCKNNYSTAYSMYRHMRKVHNCDVNRCVTLYCPIENCNQSYDRYNALDTHLTHVHYADIRKETFNFSDLQDFETWLRDITSSSKTKYIKRSCNNSYRYYRCHRSGLPKTSTDKINSMKSSVKIGRHCPSRIIAKITDRNVQVEFVPTHIGHECEIAKIPLSQKKRHDIACRLASATNSVSASIAAANNAQQHPSNQTQSSLINSHPQLIDPLLQAAATNPASGQQHGAGANNNVVSTNQQQATTSTIISNDNSLMATLAPMKTNDEPEQQRQQQLNHQTIQQQTHIIATQMTAQTPTQSTQLIANNPNMSLMSITSPNRQELTSRFEQLMLSLRSDKHASIVKAQLEVCFALIRD